MSVSCSKLRLKNSITIYLLSFLIVVSFVVRTSSVQPKSKKYEKAKCYLSGKTRAGNLRCSGVCHIIDEKLSRSSRLPVGSFLCNSHYNRALADDNRCSCPSSWGHSSSIHKACIPKRLFPVFDSVGEKQKEYYKPGTRWCIKCFKRADSTFMKHPLYEPPQKRSTSLGTCLVKHFFLKF